MECIDWFNNRRLFEDFGSIPSAEHEKDHLLTTEPPVTLQMAEPPLHSTPAVQ